MRPDNVKDRIRILQRLLRSLKIELSDLRYHLEQMEDGFKDLGDDLEAVLVLREETE